MDGVQAPARHSPAGAGGRPPGGPGPGSRDRPRRRARRVLSTVLLVCGALVLLDVAVTLVWQEPFSALYAHFQQRELAAELAGPQPLTGLQRRRLARLRTERRRIAFLAGVLARRARPGQPIGRLRIRRMGIDFVVVQGTDGAS